MKSKFEIDAFILAGGVSSRMGRTKSLLEFGGIPLIYIAAGIVKPLVDSVIVVGPPEPYVHLGLETIADQEFGIASEHGRSKGPLIGIATALRSAQKPWNLILACDLPYLNRRWLAWLIARGIHSEAQVVLPQTSRGSEPLAAMYRAECAGPLVQEISRGVCKVIEALGALRVEAVTDREWKRFDADGSVLKNMNTHADYEFAQLWWNSKGIPKDWQRWASNLTDRVNQ